MPELPEVQTTVDGLNKTVKGRKILDVWTSYSSTNNLRPTTNNTAQIKNPKFFKIFKRRVVGQKILKAERRAKNVLLHLAPASRKASQDKYTIIAHMKMTGHFVYDRPDYPHVRLTFKLDGPAKSRGDHGAGGKLLALSDMRKFAKVTLVKTDELEKSFHLKHLGPEPLDPKFQIATFSLQLLKKPRGKIKQILMDQSLIAGIGNIYSDEILWRAGVHPLSVVKKIPEKQMKLMFTVMKDLLKRGIDFGGDSMSDYRNIYGEKGRFQEYHQAYRRTGKTCGRRDPRQGGASCKGVITRTVVGSRSTHFCPKHQKLHE